MFCFNSKHETKKKERKSHNERTITQQHTIDVVGHKRSRRGRIRRAEKYMYILWTNVKKVLEAKTISHYCKRMLLRSPPPPQQQQQLLLACLLWLLLLPPPLMCTRMRMTMAATVTAITLVCVAFATEYPFLRDNETTSRTCSALLSVIYVLMCEVWALGMCRFDSGFAIFFSTSHLPPPGVTLADQRFSVPESMYNKRYERKQKTKKKKYDFYVANADLSSAMCVLCEVCEVFVCVFVSVYSLVSIDSIDVRRSSFARYTCWLYLSIILFLYMDTI